MDAVKFVEERRRMFAMTGENPKYSLFNMGTPAAYVVLEVEKWAAAHPRKTQQEKFLQQWPKTWIGPSGIIQISPCSIDSSYLTGEGRCAAGGKSCDTCRREFWMQEVE